jgi:hypothetical protein
MHDLYDVEAVRRKYAEDARGKPLAAEHCPVEELRVKRHENRQASSGPGSIQFMLSQADGTPASRMN